MKTPAKIALCFVSRLDNCCATYGLDKHEVEMWMDWFEDNYTVIEKDEYGCASDEFAPSYVVIQNKETKKFYKFDYEKGCSYTYYDHRIDNYSYDIQQNNDDVEWKEVFPHIITKVIYK